MPPTEEGIEETLDALDALILSGGSDLSPETYGQDAHPETYGVIPERDDAELALLTAALKRDLPVLAICRGSQVLNVALGGDGENLSSGCFGRRAARGSSESQGAGPGSALDPG